MGCLNSTPAKDNVDGDRRRTPQGRAGQSNQTPSIPANRKPRNDGHGGGSGGQAGTSAPVHIDKASPGLSHKDGSKLGTSIDRRQREHEFFSRIVQAAQDTLIDIHGSALDVERDDGTDESAMQLSKRVRGTSVAPGAVTISSLPRPSASNTGELYQRLSTAPLSAQSCSLLQTVCRDVQEATAAMKVQHSGEGVVVVLDGDAGSAAAS